MKCQALEQIARSRDKKSDRAPEGATARAYNLGRSYRGHTPKCTYFCSSCNLRSGPSFPPDPWGTERSLSEKLYFSDKLLSSPSRTGRKRRAWSQVRAHAVIRPRPFRNNHVSGLLWTRNMDQYWRGARTVKVSNQHCPRLSLEDCKCEGLTFVLELRLVPENSEFHDGGRLSESRDGHVVRRFTEVDLVHLATTQDDKRQWRLVSHILGREGECWGRGRRGGRCLGCYFGFGKLIWLTFLSPFSIHSIWVFLTFVELGLCSPPISGPQPTAGRP